MMLMARLSEGTNRHQLMFENLLQINLGEAQIILNEKFPLRTASLGIKCKVKKKIKEATSNVTE